VKRNGAADMEGCAAVGTRDERIQMIRSSRFRQLPGHTPETTSRRHTAEESVPSTGGIESGDFRIDLTKRTVTLGGQELRLTFEGIRCPRIPGRPASTPGYAKHYVGDELDSEWTPTNRILASLDVPAQEARCRRA
jgi:hypothetical protein